MFIKYNTDKTIRSIVTLQQVLFNPILALFNISLVTVLDNKRHEILKLNKWHYGCLLTNRWNIIDNYKFYFSNFKEFRWV